MAAPVSVSVGRNSSSHLGAAALAVTRPPSPAPGHGTESPRVAALRWRALLPGTVLATLSAVTPAVGAATPSRWATYINPNYAFEQALAVNTTHVFCGTSGGLVVYDKAAKHWQTLTTAEGLCDNIVTAVLLDGNLLRVAGEWQGFAQVDLTQDLIMRRNWTRIEASSGLGHNYVTCMALAQGGTKVWFGTLGGGLNRYNQLTDSWDMQVTEIHGLTSNRVRAIVEDSRGVLWVGTDNGLTRRENDVNSPFRPRDCGLGTNAIESLALDGNDLRPVQ